VVMALPITLVGILIRPYRIGLLAQHLLDPIDAGFEITALAILLGDKLDIAAVTVNDLAVCRRVLRVHHRRET
jgi:hypothetical protein